MGLHQAFPDAEIVGVDVRPMPRYPFTFVQGDALEFDLSGFDFVWASPPCQGYSRMRHLPWLRGKTWPLLIEPVRRKLTAWAGPFIIENVEGAPLINGVTLCGQVFGLRLYRHRMFESNFAMLAPPHIAHRKVIAHGTAFNDRKYRPVGEMRAFPGAATKDRRTAWDAGGFASVTGDIGTYMGPEAMGIDWMTGNELSQAIPPVYSRYLAQFIPLPAERAA